MKKCYNKSQMLEFIEFAYLRLIKPILFAMSPDKAHSFIISIMHGAGKFAPARSLANQLFGKKYPELKTEFRGLTIESPVGLSAGLDKNGQVVPIINRLGFGMSTVGSVTAKECVGNQRPWFHRLPQSQSLVVYAGLPNEGVKKVLKNVDINAKYYSKKYPVILSVARKNSPDVTTEKQSIDDYVVSIKAGEKSPNIKMIEINISCPNAFGGELFTRVSSFEALIKQVSLLNIKKPIIIKMPSDLVWADFKKIIDIALKNNIDIFSISNLAKDRALITEELSPEIRGGLSGKPLQKLSDQLIKKTYKTYGKKVTIIGIGGIFNAEDAYKKIRLGASYVELITGMIFMGPQLAAQINYDLTKLLKRDGYKHISEAVGVDAG